LNKNLGVERRPLAGEPEIERLRDVAQHAIGRVRSASFPSAACRSVGRPYISD
jgi:hypothetical protein